MAASWGDAALDGRARRSERSRRAMVDALFELVGEGVTSPTAQEVAERAGVGLRTVFRHFSDMDTLYAEMGARLRGDMLPLLRESPPEGPALARTRALVARRARIFERIAPYKRAALQHRWRSDFLQDDHQATVRELRATLRRTLPELERAPRSLADALELVTSFEAWDRLRTDQRLGPRQAREVMEQAALALVRSLA